MRVWCAYVYTKVEDEGGRRNSRARAGQQLGFAASPPNKIYFSFDARRGLYCLNSSSMFLNLCDEYD